MSDHVIVGLIINYGLILIIAGYFQTSLRMYLLYLMLLQYNIVPVEAEEAVKVSDEPSEPIQSSRRHSSAA